jgi:glycosyltransferase involved in cell wall biosynthesis
MSAPKVVVIVPAYNAAATLPDTLAGIPPGCADEIIVVDDSSRDATSRVAEGLGAVVLRHLRNRGYGGAQKTGYREALRRGADIVVLVHADNQYDPALVPLFVSKISAEGYDVVTGSRMVRGDALKAGMPVWKYIPNRLLTALENRAFRTRLTDYHNGYRAFRAAFLRDVPFDELSDFFDFDTDIMIQASLRRRRIAEVPTPTRYWESNSQMSLRAGVRYGLKILGTVSRYLLHRCGIRPRSVYTCG